MDMIEAKKYHESSAGTSWPYLWVGYEIAALHAELILMDNI